MKTPLKILLVVVALIISLWVIGRLTNTLQFSTSSTTSNMPSIKVGQYLFTTNLVKPEPGKFICYRIKTEEYGKQIWVQRLCAMGGDRVEIRQGVLYVNDKNFDAGRNLFYDFRLASKDATNLNKLLGPDNESYPASEDSVGVLQNAAFFAEHKIKAVRYILRPDETDEGISSRYGKQWNQDNFGPIKVPQGQLFLLGDSRNASMDSRYLGCIPAEDYFGTVLGID